MVLMVLKQREKNHVYLNMTGVDSNLTKYLFIAQIEIQKYFPDM